MKINDIVFFGFTRKELGAIYKQTGKTEEEEFDPSFIQEATDVVGVDVFVFIQPGGQVSLIKAGE